MEIVSISTHLESLIEIIESIIYYEVNYGNGHDDELFEMFNSMKLLKYAGNIIEIKYSPFSEAGMYCRGVHNDELTEQQTVEPYLLNLSIFSTTWMGLESVINHMKIAKPKQGKINALCYELNKYSSEIKVPREYRKCLLEWIEIEKQLNNKYKGKNNIPGVFKIPCQHRVIPKIVS